MTLCQIVTILFIYFYFYVNKSSVRKSPFGFPHRWVYNIIRIVLSKSIIAE